MERERKKEYGGYISLELDVRRGEYYKPTEFDILRLNSGRAAIYEGIIAAKGKRAWLPWYLCDTVEKFLHKKGVVVCHYNIDENFLPQNICYQENDVVVWPNYFGIISNQDILFLTKTYKKVIIDNTQAFFAKPIDGAYNVYSPRKFFGVADGAYLIHSKLLANIHLERSDTLSTMSYLLKSIETSTNEAYSDSLVNEERINKEDVMGMSTITQSLLSSINYEHIMKKRNKNVMILHDMLGKYNELSVQADQLVASPMVYPFLIKSNKLRKRLIDNRVYVPQWWKCVLEIMEANDWERKLSKYLLPLPIDQRYGEKDMSNIANMVLNNV